MYKKIISLILAIATTCSFLVVPASAVEALPPADSGSGGSGGSGLGGISLDVVDFLEWSTEWASYGCKVIGSLFFDEVCVGREGVNMTHSFVPNTILVDGELGDWYVCEYCGSNSGYTADAHGFDSAYNQYVSSLQTDLGTTTLIDGGIRVYFEASGPYTSGYAFSSYELGYRPSGIWSVGSSRYGGRVGFYYYSIKAPFDCTYTTGHTLETNFTGNASDSTGDVTSPINRYSGNEITTTQVELRIIDNPGSGAWTVATTRWADLIPMSGTLPTGLDISINSRPTSIVGDYGIIGDDGTIIHVEGNMIVDESTNTVFNPVTNTTNNYTDYAFDYSDRSYNLTLEDGSTLKVVYGDENVTIHEGDTIYNIYYLIPDDSGSGGGSDSGDPPSGEDMSWWKQAWTSFTDKLFSILGNGGSSVNPDTAPTVPDDEATGEKGYSIIDLFVVLKDGTWAFITGIVTTAYDGFTGFVESVSSAGSFFTFYDEESEDGILFVPLEGGETIWD